MPSFRVSPDDIRDVSAKRASVADRHDRQPIDQFLDWLRGQLESYRMSIAGCLGTGPDIEDEPIEPMFP